MYYYGLGFCSGLFYDLSHIFHRYSTCLSGTSLRIFMYTFAPMLEIEFKYYLDHQAELVKKYNGKFIVLKGEKVIGSYDSHIDAYNKTVLTEKLGTFLIQHCLPGKDSYTQTFHSQVIIHSLA